MYSIGEFSKINRITTKTLRHYDKIGLMKPSRIDAWTGYRYYSPDQLVLIREILAFRDMGFSLIEIKELIINGPKEELLDKRIKEIELDITNSRNQLERTLQFRTNENRRDDMSSRIYIKELPEVIVASMRTVVPGYDTYFDIVPKMGEYMKSVGAKCIEPFYCFTIYHDGEFKETDIDVEVCEAVEDYCKESDKVKFKKIHFVEKAACIMHKGPYRTIKDSYNKLFLWVEENGYTILDNPRESYIDGVWNRDSEDNWLTEIQLPVINK